MKKLTLSSLLMFFSCFAEPNQPLWFAKEQELTSRILMIEHNLNMMLDIIYDQKYINDINRNFLDDVEYHIHQCKHHLGVESMY